MKTDLTTTSFSTLRRALTLAAALGFATLAAATSLHAQTLLNGSFEDPEVDTQTRGAGKYWTSQGDGTVVVINNSYNRGTPTYYGTQLLILDMSTSASQTISGFTPGQTYGVTFDTAYYNASRAIIDVSVSGGATASDMFRVPTARANGFTEWTLTFTPTTSADITLTFANDAISNGEIELDNVRLDLPAVAPAVATQPASVAVASRQTAIFRADATGTPAPTVQWQVSTDGVNFINVSNATAPTLSFPAALALNGNSYRAVFANGTLPNATTNAATLTVAPSPGASTVAAQTGGSFLLQLRDVAGYTYELQYTPDLLQSWQNLSPVTIDSTGTGQYTDTAHPGAAQGFYRFVYP